MKRLGTFLDHTNKLDRAHAMPTILEKKKHIYTHVLILCKKAEEERHKKHTFLKP